MARRRAPMSLLVVLVGALLALAVASGAQDASEEAASQLPRPLVIELPTAAEKRADGEEDEATELRCASWRLAGEAKNLAPWSAVPQECVAHVRRYLTGPAYRSDLDLVAREASAYARAAAARAGDGGAATDAWVFDVDETLLSNLPYYAQHGYG